MSLTLEGCVLLKVAGKKAELKGLHKELSTCFNKTCPLTAMLQS